MNIFKFITLVSIITIIITFLVSIYSNNTRLMYIILGITIAYSIVYNFYNFLKSNKIPFTKEQLSNMTPDEKKKILDGLKNK